MGDTEESSAGSLDLQSFLGLIQTLYPSPKKFPEEISWPLAILWGYLYLYLYLYLKLFSIHSDPAFIPNALARIGGLSRSQQMAKQDSCPSQGLFFLELGCSYRLLLSNLRLAPGSSVNYIPLPSVSDWQCC